MTSALPAEVLESRLAYIAVKRRHGVCIHLACTRMAAENRTSCEKCLARVARGQRKVDARKKSTPTKGPAK